MNIITFSKKGIFHEQNNSELQDIVFSYEDENVCYIALADGATGCPNSKRGAEIACTVARDFLLDSNVFTFAPDKLSYLIREEIMFHIRKEASATSTTEESFASTFTFAYLDKKNNKLLAYNLGDSAIYVSSGATDKYDLLFPSNPAQRRGMLIPDKNAHMKAEVTTLENFNGEAFLCSDGVVDTINTQKVSIKKIKENPDICTGMDDSSFISLCNY